MLKNIICKKRTNRHAADKATETEEYEPKKVKSFFHIPQDQENESCNDIITLVLKYYGNSKKTCERQTQVRFVDSINKSTSYTGVRESKEEMAQTLQMKQAEASTSCLCVFSKTTSCGDICFRFFFGPSLEETGIYVWKSYPIICVTFEYFKSKIVLVLMKFGLM
ncbi:hypothetical protein JTB14_002336 [Gonioctena quinquepunctata]|nr:hypothetical protein JTB14_002336 [Gonioctena quinquepunctata]